MSQDSNLNITLGLIKTLRKSQNKLYKEISMNEVESIEVKRETDFLNKLFNQSRINQKEYFLLIYRTLYPSIMNNNFCKIESIIDPKQIEPSPTKSQKITTLIEFALNFKIEKDKEQKANQLRKFLIHALTFSIIPSYYNFFWTEYSIKCLYKVFSFVKQKKDDKFYDKLARVAFLTPNFIYFSKLCFQPVFSKILSSDAKNIKGENLIHDIQINIKKYQKFIPDETLVVLACSSDPIRTLNKSFFKKALKTTISSQIYGFFHYSYEKKKCQNLLDKLRKIFLDKSSDSCMNNNHLIKSMMNAIICDTLKEKKQIISSRYNEIKAMYSSLFENVDDFNDINDESRELNSYQLKLDESYSYDEFGSFISKGDDDGATNSKLTQSLFDYSQIEIAELQKIEPIENKYQLFSLSNIFNNIEIFQTKLLSSIDINFINAASDSSKKFELPEKIQYYNDCNSEYEAQEQYTEQTCLDGGFLIAPMLRHLLQRADPIPIFKSYPTNETISDFIYTYLVKRGDLSYRLEREKLFYEMTSNSIIRINEKTVERALSCISFKRKNSIRLLSNFTSIEKKMLYINQIKDQFSGIQYVLEANDKLYEKFTISKKKLYDYIKTPSLLAEYFSSSDQKITSNPDFHQTQNYQKILFANILEKFDINAFAKEFDKTKKLPYQLKKYDQTFNETSLQHFQDFLRVEFYERTDKPITEFSEWRHLASKISSVPVEKSEIIEILNDAFLEFSLIRKIERISFAIKLFTDYLSSGFPPGVILGEDQLAPSSCALIILANPPMAITNLAYLNDMIPIELDASTILGGYATKFPGYLKVAVEQIIPDLKYAEF